MTDRKYEPGVNYRVAEAVAMAILHDLEPFQVTRGDVPSRVDRIVRRLGGTNYRDKALELLSFDETREPFIDHISTIVEDRNEFRGMMHGLR